jgi:hypothetical protein
MTHIVGLLTLYLSKKSTFLSCKTKKASDYFKSNITATHYNYIFNTTDTIPDYPSSC